MYRTALLTVVLTLLCNSYLAGTDSAQPEEDISGTKLLKRARRSRIQDRKEIITEFDTIIRNLELPDKIAREAQCLVKTALYKFNQEDKTTITKLECARKKLEAGDEKVKKEIGRVEVIMVLINNYFESN